MHKKKPLFQSGFFFRTRTGTRTGVWKLEFGNWSLEIGNWSLEFRIMNSEFGKFSTFEFHMGN
jgi:hypothetical protein